MKLYEFLFLMGRSNYYQIKEEFGEVNYSEIIELEKEGKISFHQERLGELWIRCPARNKWGIEEWVEREPGIAVGELRKKMAISLRLFNAQLEEAKVEKRKEGRLVLLYPLDGTHSPDEGTEGQGGASEESSEYTRMVTAVEKRIAESKDPDGLGKVFDGVMDTEEGDGPIDWSSVGGSPSQVRTIRTFLSKEGMIKKVGDEWWHIRRLREEEND